MTALLAGCGGGEMPVLKVRLGAGDVKPVFAGLIAADEPQAVLEAQRILQAGGNAFDAATTLGLTLAVTYPSSAGLGAAGACVVHDSVSGVTEALDFTARASGDSDAARFRAAIPALSGGLFALHAKYGRLPWAQVVSPAENLARFGQTVSRALARDLAADNSALMNDRTALAAFMTPRRQMLQEGDAWKQIDLAIVLSRLRSRGAGDFYIGGLGREVEDAIAAAGGTITAQDLRAYVPRWVQAAGVDEGGTRIFALPEGYGGGHFMAAYKNPESSAGAEPTAGATGFVVADPTGGAVACAISMGKPFGIGLMPKATGFLLAPAPDVPGVSRKALAPVIGIDIARNSVVFAAAAAGEGAIQDVVAATRAVLAEDRGVGQVAEHLPKTSGKRATLINMLACSAPGDGNPICTARNDPRGDGYALTLAPKD